MSLIRMRVTDSLGRTYIPKDINKNIEYQDLTGTHGYIYTDMNKTKKSPVWLSALENPEI
jgi:hypothetical protein